MGTWWTPFLIWIIIFKHYYSILILVIIVLIVNPKLWRTFDFAINWKINTLRGWYMRILWVPSVSELLFLHVRRYFWGQKVRVSAAVFSGLSLSSCSLLAKTWNLNSTSMWLPCLKGHSYRYDIVWYKGLHLSVCLLSLLFLCCSAVGTFARALDCSSSVRQPSLHMSAAAASRDITLVGGCLNFLQRLYLWIQPCLLLQSPHCLPVVL